MELRRIGYRTWLPPEPEPVRPAPPPPPKPEGPTPVSARHPVGDGVDPADGSRARRDSWAHEGDGVDPYVADGLPRTPDRVSGSAEVATQRRADDDADVAAAASELERSVREEDPREASRALNRQLEGLRPDLRGRFLDRAAPSLEQLTEKVTDLDRGETAEVLRNLAGAADLAGPAAAEKLTRPIARAIADGKLEQTGDDANGGWGGVFQGANTHNSEREFIDGVEDLGEGAGAQLLKDALTSSLAEEGNASQGERADRARGFAAAVITADSELVPDDGLWSGARNLAQDAAGLVGEAQRRIENLRERAVDAALDEALNLSESLESLEPGDSMKLGLTGAASLGYSGEVEGELDVKRNQDGSYTVTGSASAIVGVGVGVGNVLGGVGGKVEFHFDSLEEAREGTQGLAKIGMVAAGHLALPGVSLLAVPSADELSTLTNNISAVELDAVGVAKMNYRLGVTNLQGSGLEGRLEASQGMRVEFEHGRPVAFVGVAELRGEGAAEDSSLLQRYAGQVIPEERIDEFEDRFGFDPRSLQDVQGTVSLETSLKVEVRTPIAATPGPGGSALEQVEAILRDPTSVVTGVPAAGLVRPRGRHQGGSPGRQ
jgi:hypothetical protein